MQKCLQANSTSRLHSTSVHVWWKKWPHKKSRIVFFLEKITTKGVIYYGNLCYLYREGLIQQILFRSEKELEIPGKVFTTRKNFLSSEDLICFILPDNGNYMTPLLFLLPWLPGSSETYLMFHYSNNITSDSLPQSDFISALFFSLPFIGFYPSTSFSLSLFSETLIVVPSTRAPTGCSLRVPWLWHTEMTL